jgi:peptide/nickel transport system substrate-binding protein
MKEGGFSWKLESERSVLVDETGAAVEFELLTPTNPVLGSIAAVIQQDLFALGIDLSIRQEEFRAVTSRIMTTGDYESALMLLDFPVEPADIVNVLFSSGSLHMWNPRQKSPATPWEKRVDQLMWKQLRTLDHGQRFEIFQEVQRLLAEERPFIPLVNKNILFAQRRGLENVRPANTFPFSLWNVWELFWSN